VSIHRGDNFVEFKAGENFNHRNTWKYFEDYNLSPTQKSVKIAIYGWTVVNLTVIGSA